MSIELEYRNHDLVGEILFANVLVEGSDLAWVSIVGEIASMEQNITCRKLRR